MKISKILCCFMALFILFTAGCGQIPAEGKPESSTPPDTEIPADNDADITPGQISFISSMGCTDIYCTDPYHYHHCENGCTDPSHYHNCPQGCDDQGHGHHSSGHHGYGHHR